MVARLGRVIYWLCCGVALLLAIGPIVAHGLPLLEKAPPPLNDIQKATFVATEQFSARGLVIAKLPGGQEYELTDPAHEILKQERLGTLSPEQRPYVEEARRRGLLPPESTKKLDTPSQWMPSELREKVEADHARRASMWSAFSDIVPLCLVGALALFIFGRGVRYVLANE
jgi:hypothetical protein